jgi:predicted O-methyltransferase YrrM
MYDESKFRLRLGEVSRQLNPIWPEGRNPRSIPGDGPHYTLSGYRRPVSVSPIEAETLKSIAQSMPVVSAVEIGTGFGFSSFWIAAGMAVTGRDNLWLGSLDSQTEGVLKEEGVAFAETAAASLGLSAIIHYAVGSSPEAVPALLDGRELDLAFIDGNHHGSQPLDDYGAVMPYMKETSLLLFHDVEPRYSVADAVNAAMKDGWSFVTLPTSCRLGACYRVPSAFDCLLASFTQARMAVRRHGF